MQHQLCENSVFHIFLSIIDSRVSDLIILKKKHTLIRTELQLKIST